MPNPTRTIDGFVAKMTDAGHSARFGWVESLGGDGDGEALVLVASGNRVYVAGYYSGFSPSNVTFGALTLPSLGSRDMFVTRLTDTGPTARFEGAQRAGGTDYNSSVSLALFNPTLYLGGYASWPASFSGLTLPSAAGAEGSCLASLIDPTPTATIPVLDGVAFTLFPSPAHGTASVQLPAIPGTATAILTVLDALGRTVRTQTTATNAKAELGLTGQPAGLYAVRVQAGGSTATCRLVVE